MLPMVQLKLYLVAPNATYQKARRTMCIDSSNLIYTTEGQTDSFAPMLEAQISTHLNKWF